MKIVFLTFVISLFLIQPVFAQTQGLMHVEQNVRNLTKQNFVWANAAPTQPGDRIEMNIIVTWKGSATTHNVLVKETLGQGMQYEGNLKIDGNPVAGNVATENLSIGSLDSNQSKTVTFEATVIASEAFTIGTATVINSSTAFNTEGAASVTSNVQVTRGGMPTDVSTGPLQVWMIAFAGLLIMAATAVGGYLLAKQYMIHRVLESNFENRTDRKIFHILYF